MSNDTIVSRYEAALKFLYSQLPMFSRVGAAAYKPGLGTTLALDRVFGHPHRRFRSIHVGGTNGKGSCSHNLASILQASGYRTALYTSPHLVDFRERMRINGEMIPREKVVDFVERWRSSGYEGHPSFFELTMMMAFDWFAAEQVDYAVIEVGMGGRLDSTNIITPRACVITNISPDHMQFLGDTLPEIAGEKAGIIKGGIPVVIGEAEGEVREVFERRAAEVGAPITFACDAERDLSALQSPLGGDYQRKNLNTVLHAVDALRGVGVTIPESAVTAGVRDVVRSTGLRGRWEILSTAPLSICDTGHNLAGLTYNMGQLRRLMKERPEGRLRIVIGFVSDKDVDSIAHLLPRDAGYYITRPSVPRGMDAGHLATLLQGIGIEGGVYPTVRAAYDAASTDASSNDIIFTGGSTFVVADLLASMATAGA